MSTPAPTPSSPKKPDGGRPIPASEPKSTDGGRPIPADEPKPTD